MCLFLKIMDNKLMEILIFSGFIRSTARKKKSVKIRSLLVRQRKQNSNICSINAVGASACTQCPAFSIVIKFESGN